MDMLKLMIHILLFVVSGYVTCYDYLKNDVGSKGPWGRFKYFTFWNICFQTVYFGFGVFTDLTETVSNAPRQKNRNAVQKFRDALHACVAFPSAMFVTVYFWSLYQVDRDLVWPVEYDDLLPNWLNHCLHTTVLVFIVLDKLIVRHHYPTKMAGILLTSLVATVYGVWVYYINYSHNLWVYPVLDLLDGQQRVAFIASNFISSAVFYVFGNWLTLYLWGPGPKANMPEKTKDN